jgi:hypothetical protein
MFHHGPPHSDPYADIAEPRASIDELIRPGLRQAFPLPARGGADDEKFRLLLHALAQSQGGNS